MIIQPGLCDCATGPLRLPKLERDGRSRDGRCPELRVANVQTVDVVVQVDTDCPKVRSKTHDVGFEFRRDDKWRLVPEDGHTARTLNNSYLDRRPRISFVVDHENASPGRQTGGGDERDAQGVRLHAKNWLDTKRDERATVDEVIRPKRDVVTLQPSSRQ